MSEPLCLTARWVFPVTSPPIENGVLTITDQRIVRVDPPGSRTPDVDLGNCAVLPGFVNAHTHLDLSDLRGQIPPGRSFTGWLRSIIEHRQKRRPTNVQEVIAAGLQESIRYGTTLLGDIAANGSSWELLSQTPLWSRVYYEMLGLPEQRGLAAWKAALEWEHLHPETDRCSVGLSPHAPYSIHSAVIRAAASNGHHLMLHLAESRDELELLERKSGPFVAFLKELGVWAPEALAPSIEWIIWRTERAATVSFAHGNYLPNQLSLPENASIVYCPRTHAAFGHDPHPFRTWIDQGIRVAIGTDSLASNPDLDVFAEVRFLHEMYPEIPGATLLRMATINGAEALGYGHLTGSLEAGKFADLVLIPLPSSHSDDPYSLLWNASGENLGSRKSMWRGEWRNVLDTDQR